MAENITELKTDYKDDVLVTGQQRKYNLIQNSDGTVSLVDVSSYAQYGDTLKAEDFNATNAAVNALNGKTDGIESDLEALQGEVADIPPIFIDTTRVLYDKSGAGTILSYTATEDCYAAIWAYASIDATATLDDATLFITASSGGVYSGAWSGFIKKGSVLKSSNPCRAIIYGLKS